MMMCIYILCSNVHILVHVCVLVCFVCDVCNDMFCMSGIVMIFID